MLGLYSSGDIPNLTNQKISENNIKCEICTRQLWNDMSTKIQLLKELQWTRRTNIWSLQQIYKETDRLLLHIYWWRNYIISKWDFFTAPKENTILIKYFGPMYIDFDEYPSYSGAISGILKEYWRSSLVWSLAPLFNNQRKHVDMD